MAEYRNRVGWVYALTVFTPILPGHEDEVRAHSTPCPSARRARSRASKRCTSGCEGYLGTRLPVLDPRARGRYQPARRGQPGATVRDSLALRERVADFAAEAQGLEAAELFLAAFGDVR